MQQDIIGQAISLLQVNEGKTPEGAQEVELRAFAMLQVALKVLDVRAGRERAIEIVGEAFDLISGPDRERTAATLGATPSEDLAAALLGFLRQRDPLDQHQAISGHDDAGAMIVAGIAFLQERHGAAHMSAHVANLVHVVQEAAAKGEDPISAPAQAVPVLPPPAGIRNLTPSPRAGLGLKQRIHVMSDFLRGSAPMDAQPDALASIMASAMFLRERFGEAYAVGALRQVESTTSQAAALDRWDIQGATRH